MKRRLKYVNKADDFVQEQCRPVTTSVLKPFRENLYENKTTSEESYLVSLKMKLDM